MLVLDDYHVITAPEVHEAIAFLLDHLPDQLHLMIATRADPPLPLARLRSRGQLVEVRGADLRFTRDEAQQFLNEAMRLDLDAADVDALEGAHRGLDRRPAARRALVARDPDAGPRSSTSSRRSPAATGSSSTTWPTRSWPANRPGCATSCCGPRSSTGSPAPCATRSAGSPVGPRCWRTWSAPTCSWSRWTPSAPGTATTTCSPTCCTPGCSPRTPTWSRSCTGGPATGTPREASPPTPSGTRSSPRTSPRAAYLMEEALPERRRARQDSLMLSWIRALPDSVVRRSPVLSIVAGWARMMTGDLDGLESCLDDAEAALEAGSRDQDLAATWADTEDLRTAPATILVYRASLAQARGDVAGNGASRASTRSTWPAPRTTSCGAGQAGSSAWPPGRPETSTRPSPRSPRRCAACTPRETWSTSWTPRSCSPTCGWPPGDPAAPAGSTSRRSRPPPGTASRTHGPPPTCTSVWPSSTASSTTSPAPRRTWRRRGSWPSAASITENRHRWPMAMAQVRAARGDHEAATRLLEEAAALYRHGFYPDVRPIAAMKARLQIAAGDLESAASWARERGLGVDDDPDYLHEYEHLTLARLLLAQASRRQGSDRQERRPRSPTPSAARPAARRGRRRRPARRQPAGDPDAAGPRPPCRRRRRTRRSTCWARR